MANKQGFKDTQSSVYVYQEQGTPSPFSAAVGLDPTDDNKLKIVASASPGSTPIFSSVAPSVDQAGIVIDPLGGGQTSIKLIPESIGTIALFNTYGIERTGDAALTIDNDGVIGSTIGVSETVLIGRSGQSPIFSSTPSVDMISISDAPVNPTDGTNKQYVDSVATGFTFIADVRVATTGSNLTATYANGAAGVGATLTNAGVQVAITIDSVALSLNDRVLVKDQTSTFQNGVYQVTTVGSGATNWVLTRTTDYDQAPAEIKPGNIVPVTQGTVNAGTLWIQTQVVTTIGTDPILFVPFGPSGSVYLTKAANLSDVASAPTSRSNLGLTNIATQNTTNHAVIVGAAGDAITSLALGTNGQVLTGVTGLDPVFANIGTNSGLTNHGVLISQGPGAFVATTAGTTGQVLVAATGGDPAWGTVSLTAGVTGILPIANGGTNASSMVNTFGINYFDGTRIVTTAVGTAGQVLTSNGAGLAPTFQAGGGGGGTPTTFTVYNTPGSYVFAKAGTTKMIEVFAWGGGGGGGGGAGGSGGGGGGNGGALYEKIPATFMGATVTVVVGSGGTGGAPSSSGTFGTASSFGNMSTGSDATSLTNEGGAGGTGGNLGWLFTMCSSPLSNPPIIRGGGINNQQYPIAGSGSVPACRDVFQGNLMGTGGGAGGASPGKGGDVLQATLAYGTLAPGAAIILAGGTASGGAGNAAITVSLGVASSTLGFMCGGTGGGGATGAGTGGAGGYPGGGGGGGGQTGTGGAGANGLVIVIEYT